MKKIVGYFLSFSALVAGMSVNAINDDVMYCRAFEQDLANKPKTLEYIEASEYKTNENLKIKETLNIKAKSSVLMDARSKAVLYEDNKDQMLAPASMTKIMSLLVCMEEVDKGNISLDDNVLISEHAASQEGSECFLDAGKEYNLKELIKSVCVASANDSVVAIAEHCYGDEKVFAEKMNEKAKSLGMNNTHFKNASGLDEEGHYTTAYDMCLAISALKKYDLISELSKTWLYDMQHSGGRVTSLTNTNKLIRKNKNIHLAKTGHTDNAGYCLTAYGVEGDEELIVCVMGESDSNERFDDVSKLLAFGFSNYDSQKVVDKNNFVRKVGVKNSKVKDVLVYPKEDIYILKPKDEGGNVETKVKMYKNVIVAPHSKGDSVGKVEAFYNGQSVGTAEVETRVDIKEITYLEVVEELID